MSSVWFLGLNLWQMYLGSRSSSQRGPPIFAESNDLAVESRGFGGERFQESTSWFKEHFLSRRKWLFGAMAGTVRRFGRSSAREEGPKSYGVGVAIFAGPRSDKSNTVVESQRTVPVTTVRFKL